MLADARGPAENLEPPSAPGRDLRQVLEDQKLRFAEQAQRIAQAFRRTGDVLETDDQEAGTYARWIGSQVDRLSGYLQETGVDDFAAELRALASRRRVAVVGGAALLGYVCYQLLRRSNRRRVEEEAE
jgi:hypothetical protein